MSSDTATRRILGPFNRVEGDLEVHIEIDQEHISKAWVNSPLFRGFEQMLAGKDPRDALVYTPRICGICSVSQSVAAARAIAAAQDIQPCDNGQLATDLILAAENMADHLTHFYLFFMPDFARETYTDKPWFETIHSRFKAQSGSAVRGMLSARSAFLHLTGILAGKWPHSLAIQAGGTTCPIDAQQKIKLATTISAFRRFLQQTVFADELENVTAIKTDAELQAWQAAHVSADFALFLELAEDLQLDRLGRAGDSLMSYGAYQDDEQRLFKSGIWNRGYHPLNSEVIREDISHSFLSGDPEARHPYDGVTLTHAEQTEGYSWCKAPRLDQQIMEVGAVARQVVNGNPLINELVMKSGTNVKNRVIARVMELALVVPAMETWCQQLQPKQPFCQTFPIPDDAQGAGLVEAARGSLGHWCKIANGRIENYQIIAPTTWNFSPRDAAEQAGPLELALEGTFVGDDERSSAAIQHIIRSFDPCMVCTVH